MAKRGRPPTILFPEDKAILQMVYGDSVKTNRGLRNKGHETIALRVVFKMLDNGEKGLDYIVCREREYVNTGILRALGYFSEEEIPELAQFICQSQAENPQTVHYWENLLRAVRTKN
jgi:hypothetical protein